MKRFRVIIVASLCCLAGLTIANIYYLHALYSSLKEQTLLSVTEALRRADIIEILDRVRISGNYGNDDSFIRLNLLVEGVRTETGGYEYPDITDRIGETMSTYFHFIEKTDSLFPPRDYETLEDIFRKELDGVGIRPETVVVMKGDDKSGSDDNGLWSAGLTLPGDGSQVLKAYISPLNGHILRQMSGIIITSSAFLGLMVFLIWYLLHWVGRLRTIEQMKDDFTHGMTHELKTPVAVAYSAADSMLRYYDPADEERNRKFLRIIVQKLNHLSGMIESILSVSLERFNTLKLNVETVNLKRIVEEAAAMLELKAGKHVTVNIDIPDEATIRTDPLHFGNLISNLVDNAVKYSGDSVIISIKGDASSISVADNGIGIAKSNVPYIFDKFYRVGSGDLYEVEGYGLGLYYVKRIVELQKWSIEVDSRPGKGTTFTIKFRADEKRQSAAG